MTVVLIAKQQTIMLIKKNHLILVLKLLVIIAAFTLILWKADIAKISFYLKNINPSVLLYGYIILTFAQLVSAQRTYFYFASVGLDLNKKFAIGLYFVGMFFNNIMPGGIGGDAYKIYIIHKMANFSRIKSLRVLLSDRASGLFALLMLLFLLVFFSNIIKIIPYAKITIMLAIPMTIICYFFGIKILAKEKPKTAILAMQYSFLVQISSIALINIILTDVPGIYHITEKIDFMILFLVSSVLAILPISIGGVGIRELSFMYGATLLGLDPELGVAIALIYFVINLLCSLNGLFFWHRLERLYK